MANLVEFAELLGAPVVDMGARLNFPTTHPLNQSERRRQVIAPADLVLALEPVELWGALHPLRHQLVRTPKSPAPPGQKLAAIGVGDMLLPVNYQDFQVRKRVV